MQRIWNFCFCFKIPLQKKYFLQEKKIWNNIKKKQNINDVDKIPKQTTKIVLRSKKSKTKQKPGRIFAPIIENKFLAIYNYAMNSDRKILF